MDAGSKNLCRDMSNAKNSKPSLEIEVGHKGKTFYLKKNKLCIKWDKTTNCVDV
jgi:hypothetical protein